MELLIYKASAGSGKTFTLAVQYIKQLLLNPRAYRQILAVTFTNKATAEMKERILSQLYGISMGLTDSDPYVRVLQSLLPAEMSEQEIRQRASQALNALVHDYSRFRVETIDSFFQSVMRNLSRELELNPGLTVELDSNRVMADAVESMMQKLTPASPVLHWLMEYIGERIEQNRRWNVTAEVEQFGRNIFSEEYIERGEQLRRCLATPGYVKQYKQLLQEKQRTLVNEMAHYATLFNDLLHRHQLTTADLKGGQRGVSSYFRKIAEGTLSDAKVANATLTKCLESADEWVTKSSKQRELIQRLAQEELIPLLTQAESRRKEAERTINSCQLSLQHLGELQLLNHLAEEVRTLNEEQNRFLLADTTALLHRLTQAGDASFIFEKMGATLNHVMIDEFQDTSRMQWDNFRLLLDEGLAQGADSLIVGDVKQSIYRWRNGDWNILNNLRDNRQNRRESGLPYTIHVETLNTNRRSMSRIIRFNNSLFPLLVEQLNARHIELTGTPCSNLRQAYADVEQLSPRALEEGYVEVSSYSWLAEEGQETSWSYDEWTTEQLATSIRRLLKQGATPDDIAILVRKNRMIPQLASFIDQELQLPVVSDEAFRLDASPAVRFIVEALRYLTNADDEVTLRTLVLQYQRLVVAGRQRPHAEATAATIDSDQLMRGEAALLLPERFIAQREQLSMMPLYELTETLYELFSLQQIPDQDAYLFAFLDTISEYLTDHSSDPLEFLQCWDERLSGKTIAAGSLHGIRICSIHKSKGLEFKHVLIPYCDWKLENETYTQLVWCKPQEEPYSLLPLVPVNYGTAMSQSVYADAYGVEQQQLWVDSLNLLYVALTRACCTLYLFTQGKGGTIGELLTNGVHQLFSTHIGHYDQNHSYYALGQLSDAFVHPAEKAPENAEDKAAEKVAADVVDKTTLDAPKTTVLSPQERVSPPSQGNPFSTPPEPLQVAMETLKHEVEFRQSNRSADFLQGHDEAESAMRYIDRGLLLHELFRQVTCEADIPQAVNQLLMEGLTTPDEADELRELATHALHHPQVQPWFDGSWRLFNECTILWMEHDSLCNRRPDRVLMRDDEVVVIDFKFGQPRPSHQRQVNGYMQLLAAMGYPTHAMKGYLWYVDAERIEEVHFTPQPLEQ